VDDERELMEIRDRAICRRYRNGETCQAIGDGLGLTRQRVHQILHANGVVMRGPTTDYSKLYEIIDALYAQGVPIAEIGRQIGMSRSAVSKNLARRGRRPTRAAA